ncbi:hypothetical protein AAC387_Pa04g0659 [Persea americana]
MANRIEGKFQGSFVFRLSPQHCPGCGGISQGMMTLSRVIFKWILDHKRATCYQEEKLKTNYARLLVVVWTFGVLVLVTSYAAKLKSTITSDEDQPTVSGIEQLIMNGDYVGYQKGSFVFDLLKQMGFQEEKLKAYSSKEGYAIALLRGSCCNGVSAIIDEIPYIKVFLAKYGDRFTMAGPTFGHGGFGFAMSVSVQILYRFNNDQLHEKRITDNFLRILFSPEAINEKDNARSRKP